MLYVLSSKATLQLTFIHMLLKPIKLLKKEQFVLLCYRLLPGEGITIYVQVILH